MVGCKLGFLADLSFSILEAGSYLPVPMNLDHLKQYAELSPVPAILVGILLLALGRKLFWLFVAAIGFMVGTDLARQYLPHAADWVLIVGLVFGLLGAVLAMAVQKVAVSVAGFLAGGYFLMSVARTWAVHAPGATTWVAFVVGGILGALLMIFLFNWALIVFSSISGAHLIVPVLSNDPTVAFWIFVGLVVVGCIVQGRAFTGRTTHEV